MAGTKPTTIETYIQSAPAEGQEHLRRLYEILKEAAPDAERLMKWNTPFFIEPRFVFAFSAHKAHMGFTATKDTLAGFVDELSDYEVTSQGIVKVKYRAALPEDLIRRIAEQRVREVSQREDDSFW